jgi:nucleoside 2-deoxyribosyltransferase-like protein
MNSNHCGTVRRSNATTLTRPGGALPGGRPPKASAARVAASSDDFAVRAARPKRLNVYLAGAWGFPDFNANKPNTYGHYVNDVENVPAARKGFEILGLIEKDVRALGCKPVNPWTTTIPDVFIGGVMFGQGDDESSKPWSEGNLKDGTLTKDRLLYWIGEVSKNPRVHVEEYRYSPSMSFGELEEIYRNMVGDIIYRGDRRNVQKADVVFANLNAYRGDVDDGTLWEVLAAVALNKEIIVLVDRDPEPSLGEGIFGKKNRWNMMISGYLHEHAAKVKIVHTMDDVLAILKAKQSLERSAD